MVYKTINSKVIIGYIDNNYTVDNTDWIGRAPLWIHSCMQDLGAFPNLESIKSEDVSVENFIGAIPCDLKLLDAVIYENRRLPRMGKGIGAQASMVEYSDHVEHAYELRGDSYIVTTFETGTVNFLYRRMPIVQDSDTGSWFPLIPDKQRVIDAMEKYILFKILQKGYKITEFNLRDNNPATNPYLAYHGNERMGIVGLKKAARNSMMNMDPDTRKLMSNLTRSFIYDYNNYDNQYMQNIV